MILKNRTKFKSTKWKRNSKKNEGGGEYRILKDGKIFDKVGVNFSKVFGKFPISFKRTSWSSKIQDWASGISVVMHMKNPLIPAMHFNTRYICTTYDWFGGGMDVTPSKIDTLRKNNFIKYLKICVIDIIKIIIQNIKNGVMNIFIYIIEKNQEGLGNFL